MSQASPKPPSCFELPIGVLVIVLLGVLVLAVMHDADTKTAASKREMDALSVLQKTTQSELATSRAQTAAIAQQLDAYKRQQLTAAATSTTKDIDESYDPVTGHLVHRRVSNRQRQLSKSLDTTERVRSSQQVTTSTTTARAEAHLSATTHVTTSDNEISAVESPWAVGAIITPEGIGFATALSLWHHDPLDVRALVGFVDNHPVAGIGIGYTFYDRLDMGISAVLTDSGDRVYAPNLSDIGLAPAATVQIRF